MPHKYGKSTLKGEKKLSLNQGNFMVDFNKSLSLVGHKMTIAK